jgi:hypothetical protein
MSRFFLGNLANEPLSIQESSLKPERIDNSRRRDKRLCLSSNLLDVEVNGQPVRKKSLTALLPSVSR